MSFPKRRAVTLTLPQMMWVGGAIVFGTIVMQGLLLNTAKEAEAAGPEQSYQETFTARGDVTVKLSCAEGTLVAATAVFSNQFGVGGGDVAAVVTADGCRDNGPATYRDVVLGKTEMLVYLYCKGSTLIATTPPAWNQFGVSGASVALAADSKLCR